MTDKHTKGAGGGDRRPVPEPPTQSPAPPPADSDRDGYRLEPASPKRLTGRGVLAWYSPWARRAFVGVALLLAGLAGVLLPLAGRDGPNRPGHSHPELVCAVVDTSGVSPADRALFSAGFRMAATAGLQEGSDVCIATAERGVATFPAPAASAPRATREAQAIRTAGSADRYLRRLLGELPRGPTRSSLALTLRALGSKVKPGDQVQILSNAIPAATGTVFRFPTAAQVNDVLDGLGRRGLLPDLRGVTVEPYVSPDATPSSQARLRFFWLQWARRTHATIRFLP